MKRIIYICALVLFHSAFAKAQSTPSQQEFKGYYNFTYSEDKASILLEVKELDKEFLYVHSLTTGLGSNDIGLDRGQLGDGVVVKWVKSGNKLLLLQPNLKYRASSDNEKERASINQAFAKSVLYGFEIKEKKNDAYIIDITSFLMEDAHGVAQTLKRKKEGTYKLDKSRSALWMENTKSFPKNSEFEAMLTFKGTPTGRNLRSVAPDASSITVIQHHSFLELPDAGYEPRPFHPRSGSFYVSYMDYSTPVYEPIQKRFITRHRLEKKNPDAALSEPVEPIIYYLDPGTPEPVRSALLDGASWWNTAFESAGYKNAFQVKMLPDGADPMDLRYNVIQWVHRSTRGWSYGASITDPRTGEIIKGHVSLGSLRIRQDFMIAQGMMKEPFKNDDQNHQLMMEMALARIRQLGAHEVGHTLGFAHNFAASTSNRASVMDYPHPQFEMVDGNISFENAYAVGMGAWDDLTVQYSYGNPTTTQTESQYLESIIDKASSQNLRFISDSDSRAAGGAHAQAHLWDNGREPGVELDRMLEMRQVAMKQFSIHNIKTDEPLSVLEDVFVPVYYGHRYQVEATVKWIAGMEYNYATKGDPVEMRYLSKQEQNRALQSLLKTLEAQHLAIPQSLLETFPPRAYGYGRGRESFKSEVGVAFDPLHAAASSADMTLSFLLHPQRVNRLVQIKALQPENLGLEEVLNSVTNRVFKSVGTSSYATAIEQRVQERLVMQLINAHVSSSTNMAAKGIIRTQLITIDKKLKKLKTPQAAELRAQIENYFENPKDFKVVTLPSLPDGSPIGCGE
ncbi:MAG: zinc-dependent metalloprotease [Nonlabens sp.]|uniref:zinc-dependent metalloprotease n=1 Tax=Nonlabens sp. TaxID=1888209 RepID=UPI003EF569D8